MQKLNPYYDFLLKIKWSNQANDMVPDGMAQLMHDANLKQSVLSFITSRGCKPTWGGYEEYSVDKKWGLDAIKEFQAQGGDPTISFGGASGIPLEGACSNVNDLSNAIKKVINTYNIKKLDFDIEGANLSNTAGNTNLAIALHQIQSADPKVAISLTLPVLPSGLTPDGLNIVQLFKQYGVNFAVNIMAMDYGQWAAPNPEKMADYAINALDETHKQLKLIYPEKGDDTIWKQMAITPMIGVNDIQTEFFSLEDAKQVADYAKKKGVEIRYWSLNRDHPCRQPQYYANTDCSGTSNKKQTQTSSFDYAKAFKGGGMLAMTLAHQWMNATQAAQNDIASDNSDDSSYLKLQIAGAAVLGALSLLGTGLIVKKLAPHAVSGVKSLCSFWRRAPDNDAEKGLNQNEGLNYHTFN